MKHALLPAAWTRTRTRIWRRRWTGSAGCSACRSSRLPRAAMPGCWAGCAGSAPCTWSASSAPGATAPGCPARGRGRDPGRRGRPLGPAGPAPSGQVGPAGRGQRGEGGPVRPRIGSAAGRGWPGRGDPGADGRQAHRAGAADPGDQPGKGADLDRPGRHPDPVQELHPGRSGRRAGRAAAAPGQHGPLPHPAGAARARPPRPVPRRPARAAGRADHTAGHRPRPRPAPPLRRRPGHRRDAAHRGRGSPKPAAVRSRLGAPVRGRADPGLLRQGRPAPAQPRRGPAGQPRLVADRDHPDGLVRAGRGGRCSRHRVPGVGVASGQDDGRRGDRNDGCRARRGEPPPPLPVPPSHGGHRVERRLGAVDGGEARRTTR
jgi:hypothetical protein